MNPYYQLPNLVHPSYQPDFRALENRHTPSAVDVSLSRTAYRLVNAVDRLLFNRKG